MDDLTTAVIDTDGAPTCEKIPTIIVAPTPDLLLAAGADPGSGIPTERSPALELHTYDPTRRIPPGAIRRNKDGQIEPVPPPPRQRKPIADATVIAPAPAALEATVAWTEDQPPWKERLARRKNEKSPVSPGENQNGLSPLTWILAVVTAIIVGYVSLRPSAPHSAAAIIDEPNAPQASAALVAPAPPTVPFATDKPSVPPGETKPAQQHALERLAVDALLDGKLEDAARLYRQLLRIDPNNPSFQITLEILNRERTR